MRWRHTWPERGLDFVAEDDGYEVGRIYRSLSGPKPLWEWAANGIDNSPRDLPCRLYGTAETKQAAADAVRAAWEAAKAWSAATGTPLNMSGRMRPPDPGRDEAPGA